MQLSDMIPTIRIRDPLLFLEELDVVKIWIPGISAGCLSTTQGHRWDDYKEYTLHEFCHCAVLGGSPPTSFPYNGNTLKHWIAKEINKVDASQNEVRTLAAEVVVMQSLGVIIDHERLLAAFNASSGLGELEARIQQRFSSTRMLDTASKDARRAVRLIRRRARDINKKYKRMSDRQLNLLD